MLNGLAWLVRLRLLPSLLQLARLFHFVSNVVRWGEHRGGMFVSIDGIDIDGNGIERSWHLLAEGDDGPFIPSMAVEAIVRRGLAGASPAPGARSAVRDLELTDYEALFRNRAIYTGRRESRSDTALAPLYQRLLGDAWKHLPAALQTMHDCRAGLKAEGVASVERGRFKKPDISEFSDPCGITLKTVCHVVQDIRGIQQLDSIFHRSSEFEREAWVVGSGPTPPPSHDRGS
jgi:hypothetical protein